MARARSGIKQLTRGMEAAFKTEKGIQEKFLILYRNSNKHTNKQTSNKEQSIISSTTAFLFIVVVVEDKHNSSQDVKEIQHSTAQHSNTVKDVSTSATNIPV